MLRRFIPTATRFIQLQSRTPLSRQFVTSSSILTPLNRNKLSVPKPTPNKMSAPEQGGSAVNLHPDPVTGEMISKSELKKREKQRAKDAARAEKKAAAPAPVAGEKKEKSEKDNEEELDAGVSAQELRCNRSSPIFSHPQFVAILRSTMQEDLGIARVQVSRPVPAQVPRHPVCAQLHRGIRKGRCHQGWRATFEPRGKQTDRHDDADRLERLTAQVSLAGRLGNMRSSGNKLHFYDLTSDGTKVQILAQIQ